MTGFILAALLAAAAEPPIRDGDAVGIAEMHRDGRITLRLRSVECDGMIAEGMSEVRPGDAAYGQTIAWIGGIRRGETKRVIAKDVPPCPGG